ncbi:Uncharacterised protein [Corynebacterium matruchotii]|jgi:hypothetical protein|nr:hypothetical protein F8196_10185 [Corynebacterium matruchotii]QIP45411.1 hypothetical protein HBA49_07715 [Corynebacterium matruchotii]SPW24345.1 Uncharacterised protein [Corynebacterium matruchotii]
MKNLRLSKQMLISIGLITMIMMIAFISTYIYEDYRYEKQQALIGPTLPQESAGTSVDESVGTAITTYLQTLDAEWSDQDCSLKHCPNSSKSLPGVPQERAMFTKYERSNVELRGKIISDTTGVPVSSFSLYSTKQEQNGAITAIVNIMIMKCYSSKQPDSYSNATDTHKITLSPSTTHPDDYVVMEDQILDPIKFPLANSSRSLYTYDPDREPQCPTAI